MKCPNCGSKKTIRINRHADGFSSSAYPPKECGKCGLVWRLKPDSDGKSAVDVISPARQ